VSNIDSVNKARLDRTAIWLSSLCLVHCLAVPATIVLTPSLNIWFSDTETLIHWILLIFALPVSMLALWRGYQNEKNISNFALGTIGLALMFLAVIHVLGEDMEIPLTVIGAIFVLIAHVKNLTQHQHIE
jgi:hypothetical protein